MLSFAHSVGARVAFETFGVKHASAWNNFLQEAKHQAVGDPAKSLDQFRAGTLFKPGKGLLHKGLPHTPAGIAASLAWPVMGSILLARNSPEASRGEIAGDFVGRSVGSLVGGPLAGAVGQLGGGMLLAPVGQAIGKALSSSDVANRE